MEASAPIELAKHVLLAGGIVLAAGIVSGFAAQKLKVPDVVVLLLAGIALGPEAFALIDIKADSALNQLILIFGSCYILFDGGASLRFDVLKKVWITISVLATLGVLVTALITAAAAFYLLKLPWTVALLLGMAIASTDPATLVPIFRQVRIRDRVAQTVMSESAFNDATGAIGTFAVLAVAAGTAEFSLASAIGDLAKQAGLGIVLGAALGYAAALLIAHEKYSFLMEYAPAVTLMAAVGAYLGADGLQASGFMAVFVFGMMLGNKDAFGFAMEPGEARRLDEYVLTTAFIMRSFIFILLGAQVDFALINRPARRRNGDHRLHAGRAAGDRTRMRGAGPAREMEPAGTALHVLDARDRRDPGGARRAARRHEGAGRAGDRIDHLHRHPDDDPDSGDDDEMAGAQARPADRVSPNQSSTLTMSSTTFFASPNTSMVLSM
jgi:cell volume regulation protein A